MSERTLRLLIVGGVAAGASAAARARRLSETAEITVIERGPDVSFANCGLPYYIGGEITDRSRLALQTPQSLASLLNITVRNDTEALRIDRANKQLIIRSRGQQEESLAYDKLLLAPGSSPLKPPLPGIDSSRVYTLRNLQDMDRIKQATQHADTVLIIGAGFIGLEMAEQLTRLGKQVTIIEAADQILPQMDREMVAPIAAELRAQGINLVQADPLTGFTEQEETATITAELQSGAKLSADFALLSIGVRPESTLAEQAGLELGHHGAIRVNQWLQTSDPDIYAAGDVIESIDRIQKEPMNLPLGGPANRQGRLVADHIFIPDRSGSYPGHLGTAIVRVFDQVAGTTGWTEKRLQHAGIDYASVLVTDTQHAGYYPKALPLTIKLLYAPNTGKLLGAQVCGIDGVDKRLDVLAAALAGSLTIDDVADLELAYAPPFGNARDVVNTAAFAAQNQIRGLVETVHELPRDRRVLDLRPATIAASKPISGALNIPLDQLRERVNEVEPSQRWVTVCALGKSSYFAARILQQRGIDVVSLSGGLSASHTQDNAEEPSSPLQPSSSLPIPADQNKAKLAPAASDTTHETIRLDCSGMSCPGPLMRVKDKAEELQAGQVLEVTATDPGFAKDIEAFCRSCDYSLLEIKYDKGVTTANIAKPAQAVVAPQGRAATDKRRKGATLVVFSGELDKVMAALVIANGAASLGGQVTLFFTFWGINALRKDQPVSSHNKTLLDRMFGKMLPRGLEKLPLSKMHFAGLGSRLMKHQMASKNLPNVAGLLGSAKLSGVRLVACTMAMEAMGIQAHELIDGVELGGVADYLESAEQTGTNLFV